MRKPPGRADDRPDITEGDDSARFGHGLTADAGIRGRGAPKVMIRRVSGMDRPTQPESDAAEHRG
jgi:hypothetical protein